MIAETYRRITSAVPAYWRKVQLFAGSLSAAAFLLLQYKEYLPQGWEPWAHKVFGAGLVVAATAQFTKKDTTVATLQTRLTTISTTVTASVPLEETDASA